MERAEIWISSDIYIPIGSYGDSFIKGWVINCIASHPDLIQYFFFQIGTQNADPNILAFVIWWLKHQQSCLQR